MMCVADGGRWIGRNSRNGVCGWPDRGVERHCASATIRLQGGLRMNISPRSKALVVVESALIFETKHGDGWRERFDKMILVTRRGDEDCAIRAPSGGDRAMEAEAKRRLRG